jgi:hypothetical protein
MNFITIKKAVIFLVTLILISLNTQIEALNEFTPELLQLRDSSFGSTSNPDRFQTIWMPRNLGDITISGVRTNLTGSSEEILNLKKTYTQSMLETGLFPSVYPGYGNDLVEISKIAGETEPLIKLNNAGSQIESYSNIFIKYSLFSDKYLQSKFAEGYTVESYKVELTVAKGVYESNPAANLNCNTDYVNSQLLPGDKYLLQNENGNYYRLEQGSYSNLYSRSNDSRRDDSYSTKAGFDPSKFLKSCKNIDFYFNTPDYSKKPKIYLNLIKNTYEETANYSYRMPDCPYIKSIIKTADCRIHYDYDGRKNEVAPLGYDSTPSPSQGLWSLCDYIKNSVSYEINNGLYSSKNNIYISNQGVQNGLNTKFVNPEDTEDPLNTIRFFKYLAQNPVAQLNLSINKDYSGSRIASIAYYRKCMDIQYTLTNFNIMEFENLDINNISDHNGFLNTSLQALDTVLNTENMNFWFDLENFSAIDSQNIQLYWSNQVHQIRINKALQNFILYANKPGKVTNVFFKNKNIVNFNGIYYDAQITNINKIDFSIIPITYLPINIFAGNGYDSGYPTIARQDIFDLGVLKYPTAELACYPSEIHTYFSNSNKSLVTNCVPKGNFASICGLNQSCVNNDLNNINIYRFWSNTLGAHFYTMSNQEKNYLDFNVSKNVWNYEKVAYKALPDNSPDSEAFPVYRYWSNTLRGHFFTISDDDKNFIAQHYDSNTWNLEKIAFKAYIAEANGSCSKPGTVPVYRFWSDTLGHHFFTASEEEKAYLAANVPERVWRYEHVAFCAYAS